VASRSQIAIASRATLDEPNSDFRDLQNSRGRSEKNFVSLNVCWLLCGESDRPRETIGRNDDPDRERAHAEMTQQGVLPLDRQRQVDDGQTR